MNDTTKREALKADLLAGNSAEQENLTGKKKGKEFVEKLEGCKTARDVVNLLCKTMPLPMITDRVSHVTENPLVLNFRKTALLVNIDHGYEPRHGEQVMLAVEKGARLTEGGIKEFKNLLTRDVVAREAAMQRSAQRSA